MASPASQLANASYAQLSTGPRTAAGKAQSAQNARKHGLTAAEVVIPFEDREEFEALQADYQTEIDPRGPLQQTLFNELLASAWNLLRIRRMETELCSNAKSYSELLDNAEIQTKLDRLARHKTRIERTFHRCLRELKALQTSDAIAPTLKHSLFLPPLACATEIARISKRTQTPSPKSRTPNPQPQLTSENAFQAVPPHSGDPCGPDRAHSRVGARPQTG